MKGMNAGLKRTTAICLVLFALLFLATASASPAGTSSDPLISLSYLEGPFALVLQSEITGKLGAASGAAIGKIDSLIEKYVGYSFAPKFSQIQLTDGNTVLLSSGASFILISGDAGLDIISGTVINITTGNAAASGSLLNQYQRYFCAEDTKASVTAKSPATGQIDGYYLLGGAGAPTARLPFADVPVNSWFFEAVDYVYENELFTGTSATAFAPGLPMTRAMFVTVLHRLDGRPTAVSGAGFSDVKNESQYYYKAVAWANANDIVNGYSDGTFKPDGNITREQMAAIMYRYAVYSGCDQSTPGAVFDTFPDRTQVSGYAAHAMRWAVSWEIIRGSGGRLLPQNTATRAEVAQIIYNYCQNIIS